jgi:Arc/MetJ-type ribon-helix-helix transcriptional regulator
MNDEDMKRIDDLISAGIGETPSEVIRYAIHNCANDASLNGG